MNESSNRLARPILQEVARYYTDKLERFGPTAAGVDWNSVESQELRFRQFLRLDPDPREHSVNDYGCGYGALADYLLGRGLSWQYHGFDISEAMIDRATSLHRERPNCSFTTDERSLIPADFTFASGIFNVSLGYDATEWNAYIVDTLAALNQLSTQAFAFNMLSTYSDPPRRRADLFYGDPLFFFDLCKRRFSPKVALLHDYPLYEFTVLVRK